MSKLIDTIIITFYISVILGIGIIIGFFLDNEKIIVYKPTDSISALEESERCKEWGGRFDLDGNIWYIDDPNIFGKMKCTKEYIVASLGENTKKVTEELFYYEFIH